MSRWGGATTWVVLTCVLGAAVIGLGIWVVVLETGHESESTASAARIHELEQAQTDLNQQVTELERLSDEADAELAKARSRTATARDRAAAQRARADLAEACLASVATVLEDLYASDNLDEQLGEAAEELKAIAAECAPTG